MESEIKGAAIVVAVDDMFFAAKIRATAEALGIPLRFARRAEEVKSAALEDKTMLIIFDLHAERLNAFELAREIKADERLRHIRLLGFFSHVQVELQQKAHEAGFEEVMPRSAFSRRLPEILKGA